MRHAVSVDSGDDKSRIAAVVAMVWLVFVAVGLVTTLKSLRHDDFDGLNNMLQVPLALPWWLVVPSLWGHTVDAWVTAGLGTVNAGLIYILVSRWDRQRE